MAKRPLVLAIGLVVALAGAAGLIVGSVNGEAKNQAGPTASAPIPVSVEAAEVAVEDLPVIAQAVGSLQSDESVILRPEIAGRIVDIPLKEGDAVRKGQPLIRLDASMLRAELLQAEASLRLSEANFERADTLFKQKAGTARTRDEALAQLQLDRASVVLARTRVEKTTIVAPFDGIVGFRSVSVGAYVTPADNLANLEKVDPLKVEFRLPEVFWPHLRPSQKIAVTVDAIPGRTFEGAVYAVNPLVDENGRSILLRARIANPERALTPGLFVRVAVVIDTRENAILVPEGAIVRRGERMQVFRVEGDRAVLTDVTLGERRTGQVEIVKGLAPEAVVVTTGQNKLRDGSSVDIARPRIAAGT